jgi:hypothetical protein
MSLKQYASFHDTSYVQNEETNRANSSLATITHTNRGMLIPAVFPAMHRRHDLETIWCINSVLCLPDFKLQHAGMH